MPQIQTDKVKKEAKLTEIRANKSFGQVDRAIVLSNNNVINKNLDKKGNYSAYRLRSYIIRDRGTAATFRQAQCTAWATAQTR